MTNVAELSPIEIELLRNHGIVIFEDRVIFEAQPPITDDAFEQVQRNCVGPIPQELRELWSVTAGGWLDYDANLELEGGNHPFTWSELFYAGANTYFDLTGWIERELENLEEDCAESGMPFPGLLSWLPIGGFEYLDRVYVCVEMGDEYGHVAFWKRGLPPAWTHRLHSNSQAIVAPSLRESLSLLHLAVDPKDESVQYRSGTELRHYLDARISDRAMSPELADRVMNFYAGALIKWESMLQDGSIVRSEAALSAAIKQAIRTDDGAIVGRLSELGERFDTPVSGTAVAVDLAIIDGAYGVLRELLRVGASVPVDVFQGISSQMPVDLAVALLARGARPSFEAAAQAVACDAPDAARAIAAAVPGNRFRRKANMTKATEALRLSLQEKLAQVRAGKLAHYLGEAGLQERVDRLASFALDG
jgi:hypothetical protein